MKLEKVNITEFIEWSKEIFIKIQNARSNYNLDELIKLESSLLFEKEAEKIKENINTNRKEVRESVVINYATVKEYEYNENYDIIKVKIKASMENYVYDIVTGEVVSGIKDYKRTNIYLMTFIRRGNKTGETKLKCDGCGASVDIVASGKCKYCGNVFYIDVHDLVVDDIEIIAECDS